MAARTVQGACQTKYFPKPEIVESVVVQAIRISASRLQSRQKPDKRATRDFPVTKMTKGKPSNNLPPKDERIYEGTMSRKVITSRGGKWQTRHACLTVDRLIFSKSHHESSEGQRLPDLEISTEELWTIFERFDINKDGYPYCYQRAF